MLAVLFYWLRRRGHGIIHVARRQTVGMPEAYFVLSANLHFQQFRSRPHTNDNEACDFKVEASPTMDSDIDC